MSAGTPTTKIFADRLGDLVAKRKKDTGMSQNEIADKIGIKRASLSNYLSDNREAGINALERIAGYFNVSFDWLLGNAECKKTDNEEIYKRLGLNDAAISNLENCCKSNAKYPNGLSFGINALVASDDFHLLVATIFDASETTRRVAESGDYMITMECENEADRQEKERKWEEVELLARWHYGPNSQIISGGLAAELDISLAESTFNDLLKKIEPIKVFSTHRRRYLEYTLKNGASEEATPEKEGALNGNGKASDA